MGMKYTHKTLGGIWEIIERGTIQRGKFIHPAAIIKSNLGEVMEVELADIQLIKENDKKIIINK
jgi:hypothetical protein